MGWASSPPQIRTGWKPHPTRNNLGIFLFGSPLWCDMPEALSSAYRITHFYQYRRGTHGCLSLFAFPIFTNIVGVNGCLPLFADDEKTCKLCDFFHPIASKPIYASICSLIDISINTKLENFLVEDDMNPKRSG